MSVPQNIQIVKAETAIDMWLMALTKALRTKHNIYRYQKELTADNYVPSNPLINNLLVIYKSIVSNNLHLLSVIWLINHTCGQKYTHSNFQT